MFNSRNIRLILIPTIFFIPLFLANPAQAIHPYKTESFKLDAEPMRPKAVTSGSGTSCSNDFAVENSSNRSAEIQIVLGGMPFARDQIPANSIKMYNLKKNLSIAKLNGKTVGMDDWAFVINAKKDNTPIMVYCSR